MLHKQVDDIRPYIKTCYENEPYLELFHIAGHNGVEAAVKKELELSISPNSKNFIVEDNNEFIGYFITDKINDWNQLNSFFILPKNRNKKEQFWNILKNQLGNKFIIPLDKQNIRAIKFIEKMNGKYYFTLDSSIFFKLGDW